MFPGWRKLLLDAADRLEAETKIAEAKLVRSLLEVQPPDFLDAAKRARNALGPVWYSFLKGALEIEFSRIDPESLELARRIWQLGSNLVITNAAQIVLSPDGYELLYPEPNGNDRKLKYEAALNTLRNQIVSKSLLFVGFSLDDEYLRLQLRRVQEIYEGAVGPHYAIVREEQAERVRNLKIEPLTVANFSDSLMALMASLEVAAGLPSLSWCSV